LELIELPLPPYLATKTKLGRSRLRIGPDCSKH
jgi:hypothetical protein